MINQISYGKAFALTRENNQKNVQQAIAFEYYRHVFISPEIAWSKKFKANVLNDSCFAIRLSLLAIDNIHLVEQQGKGFCALYVESKKVEKHIPPHVPLLGVSTTLTQSIKLQIINKIIFRNNYQLMQTSLDRPEIQQIYCFMTSTKSNDLDLQFILPPITKHALNI